MKRILLSIGLIFSMLFGLNANENNRVNANKDVKLVDHHNERPRYRWVKKRKAIKLWKAYIVGQDRYGNWVYGFSYDYATRSKAFNRAHRECRRRGAVKNLQVRYIYSYNKWHYYWVKVYY